MINDMLICNILSFLLNPALIWATESAAHAFDSELANATFQSASSKLIQDERYTWWFEALWVLWIIIAAVIINSNR